MYMVNSMVEEASGLLTVSSTLYLQLTKADKDSRFHCSVEYNMPDGRVETKDSEPFTLTLHCERSLRSEPGPPRAKRRRHRACAVSPGLICQTVFF